MCRRVDLCLGVQIQVLVVHQLLENSGSGCTGADAGAFDLLSKLIIFDELSGILHGKNHAAAGVSLGRGGLSFLLFIAKRRQGIAFF